MPSNIALVYGGLNENNKAFEWLEQAYQQRNGELVYFKLHAELGTVGLWGKDFRADRRLERIGLNLYFSDYPIPINIERMSMNRTLKADERHEVKKVSTALTDFFVGRCFPLSQPASVVTSLLISLASFLWERPNASRRIRNLSENDSVGTYGT